jgi:hypothetical protein
VEKCKNIECDLETVGKKKYCSLGCRNIYVNKYLRDYNKVSITFKEKRKNRECVYLENPKLCKKCLNIIPYEKVENDFCDSSCSAIYNNKDRECLWKDKIRNSVIKNLILNGKSEEHLLGKSKCKVCCSFTYSRRKKYCSDLCRNEYRRIDMDEFNKYKLDAKFDFSLKTFPDEFDFNLVEKYGWYKPINRGNNIGGVSRDHMLSVREGYEMGIDPKIISHPANCRLMIHSENISKNKKSVITLEELLERIEYFNNKYNLT